MSIEGGGLKGDLAPKPKPEESKLRGSLVSSKEGSDSELEPFSDEWLKTKTFIYKGDRKFKVKGFSPDNGYGEKIVLQEQKVGGGNRAILKADFVSNLRNGVENEWRIESK